MPPTLIQIAFLDEKSLAILVKKTNGKMLGLEIGHLMSPFY
jgi:hypothetical protein